MRSTLKLNAFSTATECVSPQAPRPTVHPSINRKFTYPIRIMRYLLSLLVRHYPYRIRHTVVLRPLKALLTHIEHPRTLLF